MKKILFFSRDPGASNVIIPAYKAFKEDPYFSVDLYGKEYALDAYRRSGLIGKDISTVTDLEYFLGSESFDVLVTGTTSDEYTDRLLWKASSSLGIVSVAILDQWMNYKKRFTMAPPGQDVVESDEMILPDFICVMNEQARNDMVVEGIPTERIIVTGQPYLELTMKLYQSIETVKISELRAELGLGKDELLVVFASEPIVESYSESLYFGYNQMTVLQDIISMLRKYSDESNQSISLLIKLHPRNNPDLFHAYQDIRTEKFRIIVEKNLTPQMTIAIADVVLGMSSMLLLEAIIANKPTLSVQIGLTKEDPFVLSRLGQTKTVLSRSELEPFFKNAINRNDFLNVKPFLLVSDATNNIVKFIKQKLL